MFSNNVDLMETLISWVVRTSLFLLVQCSIVGTTIILGFHVTSQALLNLVSAMLVSLGCQIYANKRPFLQ